MRARLDGAHPLLDEAGRGSDEARPVRYAPRRAPGRSFSLRLGRILLADAGRDECGRALLMGGDGSTRIGPLHALATELRPTYSRDSVARDVPLPDVPAGDVLAILDLGAYDYCIPSRFLFAPRPAQV